MGKETLMCVVERQCVGGCIRGCTRRRYITGSTNEYTKKGLSTSM